MDKGNTSNVDHSKALQSKQVGDILAILAVGHPSGLSNTTVAQRLGDASKHLGLDDEYNKSQVDSNNGDLGNIDSVYEAGPLIN
ncbi:hypothetical protein J6590_058603 [Homalodisca vitripennis]|nr:hypothetical protein J6590_058603 [Homalodisca vitripennis]